MQRIIYIVSAIGNAVAILTDVEKRKQYDMYGSEEERMQSAQAHQNHSHYNYTRGFESITIIYSFLCYNCLILLVYVY